MRRNKTRRCRWRHLVLRIASRAQVLRPAAPYEKTSASKCRRRWNARNRVGPKSYFLRIRRLSRPMHRRWFSWQNKLISWFYRLVITLALLFTLAPLRFTEHDRIWVTERRRLRRNVIVHQAKVKTILCIFVTMLLIHQSYLELADAQFYKKGWE